MAFHNSRMKLRLLGNRVLLRVLPRGRQAGSIELVERLHPSSNATVVAVGSQVKEPLAPGQRVGFRPMQGSDLDWEGVRYRLVEPRDIVGVFVSGDVEVE